MQIKRQAEAEIQTRIVTEGMQMNRQNTVRVKRIAIIMSALMLTLLLCGCRTRVSNNTEVTNVLEDGGMLQESYQARRDELGIPVAETPLFTGWGSDSEEYDDYYEYDEEFEDFGEYEEEYEDYEEEDDTQQSQNTGTTTTNPATRPQHQPVTRPAVTQPELIKVTLDVNAKDAVCSASFIMVKQGTTYGAIPDASREGYDFKGWYTAKKDGSKISSDTKLKSQTAHTLYAHWKKAEKKSYTVTFDSNADDDEVNLSKREMKVEEGGKYGKMPSAKRKKYSFRGWYTDPDGGSKITADSKFSENKDQTLYAHWKYDPYAWWESEFSTAANDVDDAFKVSCIIDGGEDEEAFVNECKGYKAEDDATAGVVVRFIENYSEESAAEEAGRLYSQYGVSDPGIKVVIVSDRAIKGKKEEQLLYKMLLFDALYSSGDEASKEENAKKINDAAGDLYDGEYFYPYIYTAGTTEQPQEEVPAVEDGPVPVDNSAETGDGSLSPPIEQQETGDGSLYP